MNDRISLLGLIFHGRHGVSAAEKKKGQPFVVDLHLLGDYSEAARLDDLSKSVDYSNVYDEVKRIVEGKSCNLIEHLAHRIAVSILAKFKRAREVTVCVKKPNVPLPGNLECAEVEITRRRKRV